MYRDPSIKGPVAMELKDDSYCARKVDEIAQSFDANYQVN